MSVDGYYVIVLQQVGTCINWWSHGHSVKAPICSLTSITHAHIKVQLCSYHA